MKTLNLMTVKNTHTKVYSLRPVTTNSRFHVVAIGNSKHMHVINMTWPV